MRRLRFVPLLVVALVLIACGGDDKEPARTPTATPSATPTVGITPMVLAAPTPFLVPTPTPVPTPLREVKGLFNEPRPTAPSRRVSLDTPVSPFTPPDGRTVVVYDLATGKEQRFGPGQAGSFSGDYFTYWADSQEAWLVNLRTGERRSLGANMGAPGFLDDNTIWLKQDTFYDIPSGQTLMINDLPAERRKEIEQLIQGGITTNGVTKLKDGSVLPMYPGPGFSQCDKGPVLNVFAVCAARQRQEVVLTDGQRRVLYHFQAAQLHPGVDGEALLFTPAVCNDDGKPVDCLELGERVAPHDPYSPSFVKLEGTTNLFSLDLESGQATFIATSRYVLNTRNMTGHLPFVSDDRYVIWAEGFCHESGVTRIYDRRAKTITELDQATIVEFAAGKLRAGPYYLQWLLEPGTWRRVATLPAENGTQYRWSKDNRYVAAGMILGKGGPCI